MNFLVPQNKDIAIELRSISSRLMGLSMEISHDDISTDCKNVSIYVDEIAKRVAALAIEDVLQEGICGKNEIANE